jgi:hypothetical protein
MNSDIKREVELVESVYTQTQALIDGMPSDGEGRRMQIKDMAEAVASAVAMEPKDILHMVNRYAHNTASGYVTRGKKGGFIKGVKPIKAAPSSSPSIDSSANVADLDDTSDAAELV